MNREQIIALSPEQVKCEIIRALSDNPDIHLDANLLREAEERLLEDEDDWLHYRFNIIESYSRKLLCQSIVDEFRSIRHPDLLIAFRSLLLVMAE
jgi:hypothetical protein